MKVIKFAIDISPGDIVVVFDDVYREVEQIRITKSDLYPVYIKWVGMDFEYQYPLKKLFDLIPRKLNPFRD